MTKEQCALVTSDEVTQFIRCEAKRYGIKHPSIGEDEFYSIGLETACLNAMNFNPKEGKTFLHYITKYVIFEMRQRVRRDVYGIRQENNKIICTDVTMIEEIKLKKSSGEVIYATTDEKLSFLIDDMDKDSREKWNILEPLLGRLTDEERELVMTRFGFFDNHGEATREYMKKHKMSKTTFYDKSDAIVKKLRAFAQENN